jgi:hypothetical protein
VPRFEQWLIDGVRKVVATSSTVMSELFDDRGLVALWRPCCLDGEDQPDAAGEVLVLAGRGGIEQVGVPRDQQIRDGPGEWGGFTAGEIQDLAGVLRDALCVLLAVLIPDLWMAGMMMPGRAPLTPLSNEPAVSAVPSLNSFVASPKYHTLPSRSCAYQSSVSSKPESVDQ